MFAYITDPSKQQTLGILKYRTRVFLHRKKR